MPPRASRTKAQSERETHIPPTTSTPMLTVVEVCAFLRVPRRTFDEWRAKGTGPTCFKLPNGQLRIDPAELATWLADAKQRGAA